MTKVLVVEDNPLNMELILEILKSLGFIVYGATDGEDAVRQIEKEQYDLILMDIELPVMDGISAIKVIKSRPGYNNVVAVALTAFAMKGDRKKFLAAGFDDYIAKPIDVSDFIEKMRIFENNGKSIL